MKTKAIKILMIPAVILLAVLVFTNTRKCVASDTNECVTTDTNECTVTSTPAPEPTTDVLMKPVQTAQTDGYTLSPEQLEMSDEDLVASLPVPQTYDDVWDIQEPLYNEGRYEAYDSYQELHWERLQAELRTEQKAEMLQAAATFVKAGGVKMTTRIKVDPVAYAGLMTAASAPNGTDLETGVQFDPEGDQVLINYGQPGRAPAVTVTYPITGMIEQMGQIMSQFDPEIGEEIPEAVAEWQATRQDIVERLAQQ